MISPSLFPGEVYINGPEKCLILQTAAMSNRILEFIKTNHFLYSQWDRSIDDAMLYKKLPQVECNKCFKDVVVVMPSFLTKKGILKNERECLIIIFKNKLLLTAYWCDHPNYIFKKEKKGHFQILY